MKNNVRTMCASRISWWHRFIAVLLLPTLTVNGTILAAADDNLNAIRQSTSPTYPAPVKTPSSVKVNRKLPKFTPPPSTFSLPSQPSDQEVFTHPLFEEPLVPIGAKTATNDNAALAEALTTFSKRTEHDDGDAVEKFLDSHPHSPWRLALLVNLGLFYRETGWYSKAMNAWQTVWNEGQSLQSAQAKPLVDRGLAEILALDSRLGRSEGLKVLIPMAEKRNFKGSSKQKLEAAKQSLALMQKEPGTSFRCGPMAVEKIRNVRDNNDRSKYKVMSTASTQLGTSMLDLQKLSQKLGLNYQVAKRTPAAILIVPAVVSWKVGHYASILEQKGNLWRVHDPSFGNDIWVSSRAIDEESSGYFLVPSGSLPDGWHTVASSEAASVWGKGTCVGVDGDANKKGPRAGSAGNRSSQNMATYTIYQADTSLSVEDTPLHYKPAFGPEVDFTVSFSQREVNQPSTFTYTSLGPLWTCNWLSYITDSPGTLGADVTNYMSGGGTVSYTGYVSTSSTKGYYAPQQQTGAVLQLTGLSSYELDMPDGSKQIFGLANSANPRKIFMTQSIDPQGNALTYTYDSYYRIVAVTDAPGLVTTVTYASTESSNPAFYDIATVTDPFSRTATLTYTSEGDLASSTDMLGMTSYYSYTYQTGVLQSMQTPYGTTSFNLGEDSDKAWVQVTDPEGGNERVETWVDYNYNVPASVSNYPAGEDNSQLNLRNSFYWNKKAMLTDAGGLVYTDAQITHWLLDGDIMTDEVESTKAPLESRVYYNYAGQPDPTDVGTSAFPIQTSRILDNLSTQVTYAQYNSMGKVTQTTDAMGRITNCTYADNNIDPTQITQVKGGSSDVLASATYNSQHEPLTTVDASGQTTTYTYNSNGLMSSVTDALGETTTAAYNSSGQLTSITGPQAGATNSFTYDGFGRIASTTDLNGHTLNYNYDNLDRPTLVSYPDGSTEQNVYTALDITLQKDRQGRWTKSFYNAADQIVATLDPQGRLTNYERDLSGQLNGLVDALGHRTSFGYDLEGRITNKGFADGTNSYSYSYDTGYTSRLISSTDPKGQTTTYAYNADDTPSLVTYADSTVALSYDTYYQRPTGMTKTITATGMTYPTGYAYNATGGIGGGQVTSETGPLGATSTISYTYDALGRQTGDSINGVGSSTGFDSLGRISTATNPLGTFTYGYYGVTPRLQTISNNATGLNTSFSYQTGSTQDYRLTDITNYLTGTTVLSKFDYTYNSVGTIATRQEQTDSNTPTLWTYGYDKANQLLSAIRTSSSGGAVLTQDYYQYDSAGNRLSSQQNLSVAQSTFNSDNQTTGSSAGGPLEFSGTLSKPGTVTVGGNSATTDSSFENFAGTASVNAGTNNVPVVATSANGYATTNTYQVVVPPGTGTSPTYDADGNLTNNGNGQSYTWDAENELTSITYASGATSNFTYDALGRRIGIVEKNSSGTVTGTRQFVWVGGAMAEERDATNTVTKRFYAQGEQIGGSSYYYTRDHLGSVREMTNAAGALVSRLDYDPCGQVTVVSGTTLPDMQYAGYYEHAPSALNLTLFRAYDPSTSKWLSRDPLGESQGPNLYAYCDNDGVNATDPYGLHGIFGTYYLPHGSGNDSRSGWYLWDYILGGEGYELVSTAGPGGTRDANSNVSATPSNTGPQSKQKIDYTSININIAIPNPFTLTLVGGSFTLNIDRYGDWFLSPGLGFGKSTTFVSGSITYNYLAQPNATQAQLSNFLSAWGFNATEALGIGWDQSYTPGSGWSSGAGAGTPQIGASGSYGFQLPIHTGGW